MTETPHHDSVGSLAEEAAKLITAVQEWTRRVTVQAPIATGAPECQWCPVCQLISMLRGERPDLAEKAGDATRTVVNALVAAFASPHPHPAHDEPVPPESAERTDRGEPVAPKLSSGGKRVERIILNAGGEARS